MVAGRKKIVIFILVSCMGCFYGWEAVLADSLVEKPMTRVSLKEAENDGAPKELVEAFIYFVHANGRRLTARSVYFPRDLGSQGLGMAILNTLMAGPADPSLVSVWPSGTRIRAFFIAMDGRAWVDLDMNAIQPGQPVFKQTDTLKELLAIYAVVNSLALNLPEVKQVKLLVNGSDRASLGGHVSLEYFYTPNMLMVK